MNWKSPLRFGNSEQMSDGVIDVIETQGEVDYPHEIQGVITVHLHTSASTRADAEFIDRVVVASLLETGYDELDEFRCFEPTENSDDPSPWEHSGSQWTFEPTEKAVQIAKQRGTVTYGKRVFGTVRAVVSADVPWNWSPEEKKWTCIDRLLRDGPDQIIDVDWTETTSPPAL